MNKQVFEPKVWEKGYWDGYNKRPRNTEEYTNKKLAKAYENGYTTGRRDRFCDM